MNTNMNHLITDILHGMGDLSSIERIQRISGGSISDAYKVTTQKRDYFLKYNNDVPADFFKKEAQGLALIRETKTIPVPEVYQYSSPDSEKTGWIVLEWIEGQKSKDTDEHLGRGVAMLHHSHYHHYGLAEDGYIGQLHQPNGWHSNWVSYLREERLHYQASLAKESGNWNIERERKMERLLQSLEKWIPQHGQPVLLHGDLWGGNWIVGAGGQPYVIDSAVFYGEREFELAFTELFGGFSRSFYDAYHHIHPRSSDYEDRRPLYQLYYLLVHLTIFGEAYGQAVDRILTDYGG